MSLVTKTIDSRILSKEMNLAVYRPAVNDNSALPVLYFLHGRTGNESLLQWLGIEKIADAMIDAGEIQPLIMVCPNLDNSTDMFPRARKIASTFFSQSESACSEVCVCRNTTRATQ